MNTEHRVWNVAVTKAMEEATVGEYEAELVATKDAAGGIAQHIKDRLRIRHYKACMKEYSRFKNSSFAWPSWLNPSTGEFSIDIYLNKVATDYPSSETVLAYIESMKEFDAYNLPLEYAR